jgi:hypothetical protein
MRLRRLFILTALCFAAAPAAADAAYFDVGKLPPPTITGKQMADDISAFAKSYPTGRATGSPGDVAAAEFFKAEAIKAGLPAEIQTIAPSTGQPTPGAPLRVVTALKKGTTRPDEYILMMGHYDTVSGFGGVTLEGAYDNASGTVMILEFARALANVPTNRSILFVWYNGEEEGVLASDAHAQKFLADGNKVHSVFGFDMVGIGWPVAAVDPMSCLCIWHGEEDEEYEPLMRYVNYDVLKFPEDETLVSLEGVNSRNSDESSWDTRGVKSMRWAGRRTAASYPAYHMPDDTMETIDEVAGGRTFFEQGLRNTFMSAYLSLHAVDSQNPTAAASATGKGTVKFSAAGSGDPDGPPASVTWDFGDGTTAKGAEVTHTYTKPGTYKAVLRVQDNIHPQVAAQAAVTAEGPTATVSTESPTVKKPTAKQRKAHKKCVTKAKKRFKGKRNKRKLAKAIKTCRKKLR